MLLINKGDFVLQSDRRVVKAADVATVRSAAEIVAAAETRAAQIREDAKAAYEEERKKGYDKGIADGKTEIAMQKLDLVDSSVAFMENVEEKMSEIVMKALKSCVAEIGDREMVIQIVRKTMAAVIRTQRQVTLKVAPELVETVRSRVSELTATFPTIETFDVVEDPRLKGSACVLETEAGVADASVESQLAAIERSLKKHIAKEH